MGVISVPSTDQVKRIAQSLADAILAFQDKLVLSKRYVSFSDTGMLEPVTVNTSGGSFSFEDSDIFLEDSQLLILDASDKILCRL